MCPHRYKPISRLRQKDKKDKKDKLVHEISERAMDIIREADELIEQSNELIKRSKLAIAEGRRPLYY